MNETEQLKKNTEESKARQVVDQVNVYLDSLTAEMDETNRRFKDSTIIYGVAWLAWFVSGFTHDLSIEHWFMLIFMGALVYCQSRLYNYGKATREFVGALKILELLGYIRPRGDGDRKQKTDFFAEGISMVKRWFAEKKEVQEKVYAPA